MDGWMDVSIYICMYICIYVCIYVCMYAYVCMHVCIMYVCVYASIIYVCIYYGSMDGRIWISRIELNYIERKEDFITVVLQDITYIWFDLISLNRYSLFNIVEFVYKGVVYFVIWFCQSSIIDAHINTYDITHLIQIIKLFYLTSSM